MIFQIAAPDLTHLNIITELTVYPNPFNNRLKLTFPGISSSNDLIEITDVMGRKVLNERISSYKGENTVDLDVSSLLPGSYFLSLRKQDGSIITKIVLKGLIRIK